MPSLNAEFEPGSKWDSRTLFTAVVLLILSFASTNEFPLWDQTDRFFLPLLLGGVLLVFMNIVARLLRPKLSVCIFRLEDEILHICPVKNLQLSGWVALDSISIEVSEIACVRVYDFYSPGTKAGMYWVCITFLDRRVVEYNLEEQGLVREIVDYFNAELPQIDLDIDKSVQKQLSR